MATTGGNPDHGEMPFPVLSSAYRYQQRHRKSVNCKSDPFRIFHIASRRDISCRSERDTYLWMIAPCNAGDAKSETRIHPRWYRTLITGNEGNYIALVAWSHAISRQIKKKKRKLKVTLPQKCTFAAREKKKRSRIAGVARAIARPGISRIRARSDRVIIV